MLCRFALCQKENRGQDADKAYEIHQGEIAAQPEHRKQGGGHGFNAGDEAALDGTNDADAVDIDHIGKHRAHQDDASHGENSVRVQAERSREGPGNHCQNDAADQQAVAHDHVAAVAVGDSTGQSGVQAQGHSAEQSPEQGLFG